MAQKSDFKTVETDLDELEEKIRKHRRKIAKRIIIVVAAVVALFLIVWLWMALRTYKSFDVTLALGVTVTMLGLKAIGSDEDLPQDRKSVV